jgi:hypothetical protein
MHTPFEQYSPWTQQVPPHDGPFAHDPLAAQLGAGASIAASW